MTRSLSHIIRRAKRFFSIRQSSVHQVHHNLEGQRLHNVMQERL